jgi:hypothetical protein
MGKIDNKVNQALGDAMAKRGGLTPCKYCSRGKFETSGFLNFYPSSLPRTDISVSGDPLTLFNWTCMNCGDTRLINPVVLGLRAEILHAAIAENLLKKSFGDDDDPSG